MLRIIAGHLLPDAGKVTYKNNILDKDKTMLLTDNDRGFFWRLSVRNNLNYFSVINGAKIKSKTEIQLISEFGIEKLLNKSFMSLSQGEKQKINIIRALNSDKKILLIEL